MEGKIIDNEINKMTDGNTLVLSWKVFFDDFYDKVENKLPPIFAEDLDSITVEIKFKHLKPLKINNYRGVENVQE